MFEMTPKRRWFCGLGIVFGTTVVLGTSCVRAQITPDGTLPNNSIVTPNGNTFNITGGTTAGGNLFHSFREFSVPVGRAAIFNNAVNIQNIISRVTGGSQSTIDGLIRTSGSANLFLINPNGIVFGQNASLNVGGSFVASTASAIQFGNQGFFRATNPDASAPLLTINPTALFYNQIAARIENNSIATAGRDPTGFRAFGLRVPDGKSLLLIGGNINMNGGQLNAYGGRIELSGLANTGSVALDVDGDNLSAGFPNNIVYADVSLTNGASVWVQAGGGGSITVNARNIDITSRSRLTAGIGRGLGSDGAVAGDIALNAKGEINIKNSFIFNNVQTQGMGNAGNVNITATKLSLANGARLQAVTFGQGDAGNVIINARESVSFDNGYAFSTIEQTGVGKGGNIQISADSVSLTNGAQFIASTLGQGDAGNVRIDARGSVSFDGASSDGKPSAAISTVNTSGVGKGGNIQISADSVSLTNGAALSVSTLGEGDAGNVRIDARGSVSFDGRANNGRPTAAFSSVNPSGVGKGGNIQISADSVSLTNGAAFTASTSGEGDAGSVKIVASRSVTFDNSTVVRVSIGGVGNSGGISIDTGSLTVANDSEINSSTTRGGKGRAGDITIKARDLVLFDGGFLLSRLEKGGRGRGGDIRITTDGSVLVKGIPTNVADDQVGQLVSATFGEGDAGSIIIKVGNNVSFDGRGSDAYTLVAGDKGVGNAGNITIDSRSLSVMNGARLVASTENEGNAGSVNVIAKDSVSLNNGFIISAVSSRAVGKGGDINISADSLSLTNGAQLQADTFGKGDAGNIEIITSDFVNISGTSSITKIFSALFTYTDSNSTGKGSDITVKTSILRVSDGAVLDTRTNNSRNGGNITLNVRRAEILNGGQLISTSLGAGNAGTITVNATDRVIVNGSDRAFNDRVAQFGTRVAPIDTSSGLFVRAQSTGSAGNIEVTAPQILLDNTGRLNAESRPGNGGNIELNVADLLLLRRGSEISTSAGEDRNGGDGGNITINAPNGFIVAVPRENSDITANAFTGSGGNIRINTSGLYGIEPRPRTTSLSDITASSEQGIAGTIAINLPDIEQDLALLELPIIVDPSNQIAQNPCTRGIGSEFIVTGRGGLPPTPNEDQTQAATVVGLVESATTVATQRQQHKTDSGTSAIQHSTSSQVSTPIVEAQGWVFNDKGEILLTADNSTFTPLQRQPGNLDGCSAPRKNTKALEKGHFSD